MVNNLVVVFIYSGCVFICLGGRYFIFVNVDLFLNGNYMIIIKINVKYNFFCIKK